MKICGNAVNNRYSFSNANGTAERGFRTVLW